MATVKIEGSIWATKYKWEKEFSFSFLATTDPDNRYFLKEGYVYIAPYTVEIEIDGDIEKMLHKKSIKALQKERRLILADNEKRLTEIDGRIADLFAIEQKAD
jgi:hypothetical protein